MTARFAAAPERVFAALTDHVGFGKVVGARISLERPGTPPPNGLGAVRAVAAGGLTVREEVVRFEPPHAMDYRVIAGAPFTDHLGTLRITPADGGSRLDYTIRFAWPWYLGGDAVGGLVGAALRRQIGAGLERLAASLAA